MTPAATAGKTGAAFGTKGVTVLTVRLPALVMHVPRNFIRLFGHLHSK
jgi:hypothetical protein